VSLLSVYKVIVVPTAPSLTSITAPFTGRDSEGKAINFSEVIPMLGLAFEAIRLEFSRLVESPRFHESQSAGPNGHAI